MAGDTELGLVLKNTIDAMDLNVFELVKSVPVRKFLELIPAIKSLDAANLFPALRKAESS